MRGGLCIVLVRKAGFLGIVIVRIARGGLWIVLVRGKTMDSSCQDSRR